MERFQQRAILHDLQKKMVFLAGPRGVGKTTLAKAIAGLFEFSAYFNYDCLEDRKILQKEAWPKSAELLIFDEIHKIPRWKGYLKGVYDTKPSRQKILVVGSARLEDFTRAGDSLAGRYFLHRLLPMSPAECRQTHVSYTLEHFLERGGFPEPFLATEVVDADRWRLRYIKDTNLSTCRLVFELLREQVGSPISYTSIAKNIAISPNAVKKHIQILEALYIVFQVTPLAHSALKGPKFYFFDTGLVKGDKSVRFENCMALCLLKHAFGKIDYLAERYALHYLQTKERKETDFALVKEGKIEQIIEAKCADSFLESLYL